MIAAIYFCYRYSDRIEGALGQTGSEAFLSFCVHPDCIGVQILWDGISELLSYCLRNKDPSTQRLFL